MRVLGMGSMILLGLSLATSAHAAARHARASGKIAAPASRPSASSQQVVQHVLSSIVDHVWERGDYYWHNGRYTDRIATDRLVIQMDPGFAEAYSTAAFLLENTG